MASSPPPSPRDGQRSPPPSLSHTLSRSHFQRLTGSLRKSRSSDSLKTSVSTPTLSTASAPTTPALPSPPATPSPPPTSPSTPTLRALYSPLRPSPLTVSAPIVPESPDGKRTGHVPVVWDPLTSPGSPTSRASRTLGAEVDGSVRKGKRRGLGLLTAGTMSVSEFGEQKGGRGGAFDGSERRSEDRETIGVGRPSTSMEERPKSRHARSRSLLFLTRSGSSKELARLGRMSQDDPFSSPLPSSPMSSPSSDSVNGSVRRPRTLSKARPSLSRANSTRPPTPKSPTLSRSNSTRPPTPKSPTAAVPAPSSYPYPNPFPATHPISSSTPIIPLGSSSHSAACSSPSLSSVRKSGSRSSSRNGGGLSSNGGSNTPSSDRVHTLSSQPSKSVLSPFRSLRRKASGLKSAPDLSLDLGKNASTASLSSNFRLKLPLGSPPAEDMAKESGDFGGVGGGEKGVDENAYRRENVEEGGFRKENGYRGDGVFRGEKDGKNGMDLGMDEGFEMGGGNGVGKKTNGKRGFGSVLAGLFKPKSKKTGAGGAVFPEYSGIAIQVSTQVSTDRGGVPP